MNRTEDGFSVPLSLEANNGIKVDVIGDPDGKPTIFICGWGMSTETYRDRLEELGKDMKIYSISLPGFGNNLPLKLKETNVHGYARTLAEAIDHLDLPKPFPIIGHSTGGGIATLITKDNPEWVSDLVLVTPIGSAYRLPGSTKQILLDWYKNEDTSLLDLLNLKRNPLHATVLALNAVSVNLIEDVTRVVEDETPVHMFLSKTDYIAPPGALGDIEGATIHWVEGGHTWFRHNQDEFISLVRGALLHSEPVGPIHNTAWSRFIKWVSRFSLTKSV